MALRKYGKIWHCYWKESGRVRSLSLATQDKALAERRAIALAEQRKAQKDILRFVKALRGVSPDAVAEDARQSQRATLADVLAEARKRKAIEARSEAECARFADAFQGRSAESISAQEAMRYLDGRGGKAKTFNNLKSRLSAIWSLGAIGAGISANPFSGIPSKPVAADAEHYRAFSREECRRILDAACPYWHCLALISLHTGMRLESCRRLSPEHIGGNLIEIMPGKTARFGRAVRIPLTKPLANFLAGLQPEAGMPFCSCFPPVFHKGSRDKAYFKALLDSLGIKDTKDGKANFHSLRATFITLARESGMRDDVLRGIVGHTSVDVTDLYSHDTASAVAEMARLSHTFSHT